MDKAAELLQLLRFATKVELDANSGDIDAHITFDLYLNKGYRVIHSPLLIDGLKKLVEFLERENKE